MKIYISFIMKIAQKKFLNVLGIYKTLPNINIVNTSINPNFKTITKETSDSNVSLVYPCYKDEDDVFFSDGNNWILIDGAIYNSGSKLSSREVLNYW